MTKEAALSSGDTPSFCPMEPKFLVEASTKSQPWEPSVIVWDDIYFGLPVKPADLRVTDIWAKTSSSVRAVMMFRIISRHIPSPLLSTQTR